LRIVEPSMLSSRPDYPPKSGLFAAGLGARLSVAAAVLVVLWIAAIWAVKNHTHPETDQPVAATRSE
jgi:hypothetical protein